jgi:hypothetical protein
MAVITFERISLIDAAKSAGGNPVFCEGVRSTVHIDAKSNVVFDFPAQKEGESDGDFFTRIPPEITLNWREQLKSWMVGQEHVEGTPIDSMPWITPAQAATLKGAGLVSVELLADCSDGILSPLGLNGSVLRTQAKAWLDKASGKAFADVGRLQQENDELKAQMAAMQEAIKSIQKRKDDEEEDEEDELGAIRAELSLMGVTLHHKAGIAKAREELAKAKAEQVNKE